MFTLDHDKCHQVSGGTNENGLWSTKLDLAPSEKEQVLTLSVNGHEVGDLHVPPHEDPQEFALVAVVSGHPDFRQVVRF